MYFQMAELVRDRPTLSKRLFSILSAIISFRGLGSCCWRMSLFCK